MKKKKPFTKEPAKKSQKETRPRKDNTETVEQIIARLEEPHSSVEEYNRHVHKLKKAIRKLPPRQLAEWIMERHDIFVSRIEYQLSHDFLNGTQYMERHFILIYMMEVLNLFTFLDIETLPEETIRYLHKKNYAELLSILNVLNYI